jgi:two-component system chemotaxis response regulator CheY
MSSKRILSVGQCGADHASISYAMRRTFDAETAAAASRESALERLRRETFALVLVNRILDADGESGLDLIRRMQADEQLRQVPVMLVSNYADAQEEAVAAGARPGFGKGQLGQPEMLERVRAVLEADPATNPGVPRRRSSDTES